jgi:peptidoglycan/xylan/chitin deacetylase (PgdA/CDA1 family)
VHIAEWIGEERGKSDARMLTNGELAALAAHPLVEIGGHTLTHPRLAALEPAEQEHEIAGGKRTLEDVVGRSLDAFAYPFGRPADFTDDTVRAVRDAGFRIACANYSGTVRASSDPFRLPRAYVQDCDGGVFEERLVSWLAAPSR